MAEQTPEGVPQCLWEPTMQSIWLVHDTKSFGTKGETSKQDRRLDFRLTYPEWLVIYFDVLGLDKSAYDKWKANKTASAQGSVVSILGEFDEEIPSFPMLSRIRSPFYDVVFELDEIEDFRQECLRIKASTSNAMALRGIEKLLLLYDRARQLGLSIYFVSNE